MCRPTEKNLRKVTPELIAGSVLVAAVVQLSLLWELLLRPGFDSNQNDEF